MIAIDTNLLVYAHRSATPEHAAARAALEQAAASSGWGIPAPVVAGLECGHTSRLKRPSRPAEARRFLSALADAGAEVWSPGAGFGLRLAQLAEDLDVSRNRLFDLQIALCAFEGGARELWSYDTRFVTMPGLRLVQPLR